MLLTQRTISRHDLHMRTCNGLQTVCLQIYGDKDMLSNWRSPPRPVMKVAEARKPYNWRTQENGGRREGGGGARSSSEAA